MTSTSFSFCSRRSSKGSVRTRKSRPPCTSSQNQHQQAAVELAELVKIPEGDGRSRLRAAGTGRRTSDRGRRQRDTCASQSHPCQPTRRCWPSCSQGREKVVSRANRSNEPHAGTHETGLGVKRNILPLRRASQLVSVQSKRKANIVYPRKACMQGVGPVVSDCAAAAQGEPLRPASGGDAQRPTAARSRTRTS